MSSRIVEIKPFEKQIEFLASPADIAIYGGAAFSGKSFALLMDAVRWRHDKNFRAVIFRRTFPEIDNPGGLWDESSKIYPLLGGRPVRGNNQWIFPSGMEIRFSHLQHENDVLSWQGAQVPMFGLDELTHFTEYQFSYLSSRNRSVTGSVKPYIRCTCNPDCDSWVANFIAWWIDQESGYPIASRAGKIRWFVRIGNSLIWADTPEELFENVPSALPEGVTKHDYVKSVAFYPATIYDNVEGLKADPGYLGWLHSLPTVERERLLGGNWKIRQVIGDIFKPEWFLPAMARNMLPTGLRMVRSWDLAATPKKATNDPDWAAGVKMGYDEKAGMYYLLDIVRLRGTPAQVEKAVRDTAKEDGKTVPIVMEEEPGSSGKFVTAQFAKLLDGWRFRGVRSTGPKVERAKPLASQAENGLVKMVQGPWNRDFLGEIGNFGSEIGHDDMGDAASGGYVYLKKHSRKAGVSCYKFPRGPKPPEIKMLDDQPPPPPKSPDMDIREI